jgi:hypothetical protein
MPQSDVDSIVAYSKSRRVGRVCWACSLPEIRALHEARDQGVPIIAMMEWLEKKKGYKDVPKAALQRHFSVHHELPAK